MSKTLLWVADFPLEKGASEKNTVFFMLFADIFTLESTFV